MNPVIVYLLYMLQAKRVSPGRSAFLYNHGWFKCFIMISSHGNKGLSTGNEYLLSYAYN